MYRETLKRNENDTRTKIDRGKVTKGCKDAYEITPRKLE